MVGHHLVKLDGPVIGLQRRLGALQRAQVVHHIAAAHNQHAAIAQGAQLLAQGVMLGRRAAVVHAQLHHGDRGVGEHGFEHAPRAVVQAPLVLVHAQRLLVVWLVQIGRQLQGHGRGTGRGVLLVKQLLRKTAKVVDGLGLGHAGEQCVPLREPVGRDAQHQLRALYLREQFLPQLLPAAAIGVVFDGVHGAAVAQKQDRHARRRAQRLQQPRLRGGGVEGIAHAHTHSCGGQGNASGGAQPVSAPHHAARRGSWPNNLGDAPPRFIWRSCCSACRRALGIKLTSNPLCVRQSSFALHSNHWPSACPA